MERLRESVNWFLIETNDILYGLRVWLTDIWSQGFDKWFVLILVALTILIIFLFRRERRSRKEALLFQQVCQGVGEASSSAGLVSILFETLFKVISAPAACIHLASSPKGPFLLGARERNPAFSSVAEPDWDLEMPLEAIPKAPQITKKGDIALFFLPVTIEGRLLATVQFMMATWKEAQKVKDRAGFVSSLVTPMLTQLIAFGQIQKIEEQAREASVVSGSSQALLSTTLGTDQSANMLLDLAARSTESEAGLILLNDTTLGQQGIRVLAFKGIESHLLRDLVAAAKEPTFSFPTDGTMVERIGSGSSFTSHLLQAGFRSLVQAPIVVNATPIGSVLLLKRDGAFRENQLQICRLNADRLALTIKNKTYHEAVFSEYKETLKAIVTTLESSSHDLESHSSRISRLAGKLAEGLGLSAEEAEGIRLAGELHDVGMVGLGDEILLKAGRLTEQEYDLVKFHPMIGAALTAPIRLPIPIAPLILHHHERHDGFGYPAGLKGSEIPLGARILSLGEVFDAMLTSRSYRQALTFPDAMARIKKAAGTQLDPLVVKAFEGLVEKGRLTSRDWGSR